ncbi:MAG: serine hydrolase domain-containing protein [Acidimicrobiia bacterium]
MADIAGICDDRFTELRDILSANLDSGADVGASVALTIDGEFVVDMWGGWVDAEHSAPWVEDTITNVWSTTKTMAALAALMAVDRGLLDVDAPVAKYWPEFAANGKEAVLVRHLLSHTSGVSGWEQPADNGDLYDALTAAARLADQPPWWEPGTASGYHLLSYGHPISELLRRVDGRGLKQFVAGEIAGPLGADFQIGADPSDTPRISDVIPPTTIEASSFDMDPEGPAIKTVLGPIISASEAVTPEWRAADIGAGNGHGNAHSVARIQQVIANGGAVDGVRLLSPETIDLIFREQANGRDVVLGIPLRWGIGYALPEPTTFPYIPDGRIALWGGWGGSMVVNDLDHHMTFSYVMNRMESRIIGCPRSEALIAATYRALT